MRIIDDNDPELSYRRPAADDGAVSLAVAAC